MSMIKHKIKSLIRKTGYVLIRREEYDKIKGRLPDRDYDSMREVVEPFTMVADEGLYSLYRQVLHCEKNALEGAFVECGVWKGGAAGLMALANLKFGASRRHLHLFDSFTEICEPDENTDGERALKSVQDRIGNAGTTGRLVPLKGIYDDKGGPGTVEDNRRLLLDTIGYDPGFTHFHKGWFQQTLPEKYKQIGPIAILRLDADWYASTKICLEYLFDQVVDGGFVIIDDYGAFDGCRKAVDGFFAERKPDVFLHQVNADIRYVVKQGY